MPQARLPQIALQRPRPGNVPQPTQRLLLDLPHPFARDPQKAPDLLERHRLLAVQAEVEPQDLRLALLQVRERLLDALGERLLERLLVRRRVQVVGQVVEELVVLAGRQRCVEGEVGLRDRHRLRDLFLGDVHPLGDLGVRRLPPELRFDPSGALTVSMGSHDHGQGHPEAFRQIIADKLGIPPDRVRYQFGDTDQIAIGTGTFGSRSAISGGTALLMAADKVINKGKKLAAHIMEAAEHDIEFKDGRFVVTGTDKTVELSDVAKRSFNPRALPLGMEAGLFESGTFDGGERTYPNGCHIVEVEIDDGTGAVELVRYTAVDDVGHMINPMLVEGQLHGGVAQGVGQALVENIVYQSGQIVTGSFMDYGMPRADTMCPIVAGENEVPTKTNPLGLKGAGEFGTVGALPAVMNAVNDALSRIGAPYVGMPATPEKVWLAIQASAARAQ